MPADHLRSEARLAAALGRASGGPAGSCLDEIALAALADGALTGDAHRAALAHLEGCDACRRALTALGALLDEPGIRTEVRRIDGGRAGRRWVIPLGAAGLAAAALLVVALQPRPTPTGATHRDSGLVAVPAVVAPVGDVAAVTTFSWTPVDGADRYEVILYDADGTVLWEATAAQPFVVPPDSITFAPGRTYFWQVRARVGYDQWSESPLRDFRVQAP